MHFAGDRSLLSGQTSSVFAKAPFGFGIRRSGGVAVWVEDKYADNYGRKLTFWGNYFDIEKGPVGPKSDDLRVIRGRLSWKTWSSDSRSVSNWSSRPVYFGRSAHRDGYNPSYATSDIGVLLARTP